jgi:hypothetical protein
MRSYGLKFQSSLSHILALGLLALPLLAFSDPAPEPARAEPYTSQRQLEAVAKQRLLVEDLETQYGPYDMRLKEALKGLGFQLKQAGDLAGARQAYNRALHVTRINEGLYNESQIRIVERLIDVDIRLANWEDVDNHYGYLEHLYKKLYDVDDPKLEEGLRKVGAWHFDASNVNLNGNRIQHLSKARDLLKLRLQVAERTLSGEDPLFDNLRQGIARSEYYLYVSSDIYREINQDRRRRLRDGYLATTD